MAECLSEQVVHMIVVVDYTNGAVSPSTRPFGGIVARIAAKKTEKSESTKYRVVERKFPILNKDRMKNPDLLPVNAEVFMFDIVGDSDLSCGREHVINQTLMRGNAAAVAGWTPFVPPAADAAVSGAATSTAAESVSAAGPPPATAQIPTAAPDPGVASAAPPAPEGSRGRSCRTQSSSHDTMGS